jgi:hypothetical protein
MRTEIEVDSEKGKPVTPEAAQPPGSYVALKLMLHTQARLSRGAESSPSFDSGKAS